jgi:hypothetical protein
MSFKEGNFLLHTPFHCSSIFLRSLCDAKEVALLTESEVQRSFSKLMKEEMSIDLLDKAEALLEELRPESPLRHRLWVELEEVRKKQVAKA